MPQAKPLQHGQLFKAPRKALWLRARSCTSRAPKFPPAPVFSSLRKDERALGKTLLVCPFCETANSPGWNSALGGHAKSPDSSQGCLQTLGIFILKANSISHPVVCKFEASSLLRDGRLPSKGRSAQCMQLIFGWLDIAKKALSSSAKNTRENLGLSISLGPFPLVSAGFRFFPKKPTWKSYRVLNPQTFHTG